MNKYLKKKKEKRKKKKRKKQIDFFIFKYYFTRFRKDLE
jgi:hypothetical protein